MCSRKKEIVVWLFLVSLSQLNAQTNWSFNTKVYSSTTWLSINKNASSYNSRWESVNLTYAPEWGYGIGIGTEYNITHKLSLFTDIRYNNWGGNIHAIQSNPKFYLDLAISYQSMNIPIGIKYVLKQSTKYKFYVSGGVGMDYTYKVSFIPSNYYGAVPAIERNSDIQTYYLQLGAGMEYKISKKVSTIFGFEVNNDKLLNPNRIQDFGGFFNQDEIPLSYTMVLMYLGFKI